MVPLITVVDDCNALRQLIVLLLERECGVRALGVGSLDETKERIDQILASQVIVIDINLGAGQPDGVAVYEWLRTRGFAGRALFLTGHAKNSPQVQDAARTGVPVLEKPMTADEIVEMLREEVATRARGEETGA